ncbi:TRAP transporter small permease [Pseudahrensia aquimaris]|uniref:TRAP transporter small permease protein n=1 Tax=Pseudahrensia aquimaris TaxID=744461 RepID=A0ABW3FFN9_9HYPH
MPLEINDPQPVAAPRPDQTGPVAKALDGLAALCMMVAGVMLIIIIVVFGWLVWGRYVLNDTPTWVEQLSLILVVWITFLGAAVGVHRGTHLSVDFIREGFSPVPRFVARILADLIVFSFGAIMAWQGWTLVSAGMGRAVPMLGVSEAWRVAALPVSGVLIIIFVSARITRMVANRNLTTED